MSKFTDIALPLAARGLLVMPVRAGGKEDLLKGWQLLATGARAARRIRRSSSPRRS